jgi:hypothetical protein
MRLDFPVVLPGPEAFRIEGNFDLSELLQDADFPLQTQSGDSVTVGVACPNIGQRGLHTNALRLLRESDSQ